MSIFQNQRYGHLVTQSLFHVQMGFYAALPIFRLVRQSVMNLWPWCRSSHVFCRCGISVVGHQTYQHRSAKLNISGLGNGSKYAI